MEEFKQVIIVRKDLRMSKGKLAAQVAHAAVDSVLKVLRTKPEWVYLWVEQGQKKVVLACASESDLLRAYEEFSKLGLPTSLIYDAGRTELPPNTLTTLGVGPAPSNILDKVSKGFKLL
ncbi:MAG: peptidyl-tRNA hydrolase Pth2 [Sulfolobales archaeon]|nr:peptidyl-tRNA hydrolase Pth2 [Sulfolobales archaeon]